jgi:hypothetical protein
MNDAFIDEAKNAINLHLSNDFNSFMKHKGSILLLLKELARRMLLWSKAVRENGVILDLGNGILFDVVLAITGHKTDAPNLKELVSADQKLVVGYFDDLMFSAYANWLTHKEEIRKLGYALPPPYEPYLEVFKRGGCCLKYQYNFLEVYPLGVAVSKKEEFLTAPPFYLSNDDLELADKMNEKT